MQTSACGYKKALHDGPRLAALWSEPSLCYSPNTAAKKPLLRTKGLHVARTYAKITLCITELKQKGACSVRTM